MALGTPEGFPVQKLPRPGEMGRQARWRDGFPHPTGSQGAWPSPGHAVAAMVSVHPFAAPQAPWAQRRGLPPRQPWVGICPDASLQTCCGQSRPRLPALPCQWEEEEEAVAGWEQLWKEREQDTSQAVGQEGSAVLATRYGVDWAGAAPARGLCCLHVDLAAEPSSRPLRSQWGHAPSLRAPGGTQGPSHPSSHPQSGSRAGLAAPGDLASALADAVPPTRTGYRLAGQGPGGAGFGASELGRLQGQECGISPELAGGTVIVPLPPGPWGSRQGLTTAPLLALLPTGCWVLPTAGQSCAAAETVSRREALV